MLSDHEKKRYLTPEISAYLAALSPEDAEWFWMLIEEIQLAFPSLDHYSHADGAWIGIGIKPITRRNGTNFFYVGERGRPQRFCGYVSSRKVDYSEISSFGVDRKYQHQREDIQAWLNALKDDLKDFDIHGSGLRPVDYPQHSVGQVDANVTEVFHPKSEKISVRLTTNQLLYGAAGTGKTYALQQLQQDYTETLVTQDHETFLAEKLRDRSWAEVIALVFLEESRSLRVPELIQHPLYLAKVKIHGIQKPQANAWAVLQRNAPEDSETVRVNKKSKWAWFDKDDAGLWRLLDAEREDLADLRQLLTSIQAGAQQGETIQRYRFVTFHQSYSYEDFIEGLRPVLADDERLDDSSSGGQVRYEIKQGAFVELCERARQDPAHQYAMFIDEVNRGNVSKIFGELISLIELDKRAGCVNALSVTLPYSKQNFSVPANVSIYGTMNSADRSLTPLDTALRRRFEFLEFMPQPELLAKREQGAEVDGVNLVALLQILNDRIEVLLGRDYWLGHAYFWSVKTLADLKNVMCHKVIPQLQEHCFDDWEKVRLILADNQKPNAPERQFIQVKTPDSAQLERLFGAGSVTSCLPSYQVNPYLMLDDIEPDLDVFLQAETYWAMYGA
ncbi:MAG: AAA family ATPase [Pseudomonadota bacterium]|nr:AAA family ATPase [Pseudomonadota bacterium]